MRLEMSQVQDKTVQLYTWETATEHAEAAFRLGQWDVAQGWFRAALQEAEKSKDPLLRAVCLNNIAVFSRNRGLYREARAYLEQALTFEPIFPEGLVDLRTILRNNLALVLHRSGFHGQARRLYNEALSEIPSGVDPCGPWIVPMYNLAMLNLQQGKPTQAESLLKRMRQLAERDWGLDHPYRGTLYLGLGMVDLACERLSRAETQFYKAIQSLDEQIPDEALLASRARVGLAMVYCKQAVAAGTISPDVVGAKQREAESFFEDAMRTIMDLKGSQCPEYVEAASAFCDYLLASNRNSDAELWLNRLIDSVESMFGTEHPLIVSSLERVILVQRSRLNFSAIPAIEEAITAIRNKIRQRELE